MNPVLLSEAKTRVRRTSLDVFDAFLTRWGTATPKNVAQDRTFKTASKRRETTPFVARDDATLDGELERIRPHYREPYRQDLIMGVAAYGLVALKRPAKEVRELVAQFITSADTEEHKRRGQALEGTITKHESGQRVAWIEFYRRAGVPLPNTPGPSAEVLVELDKADLLLGTRPWRGQAGLTDRSVFAALLIAARRHGVFHGEGVGVSFSRRDLAERSVVSTTTLNNALKRLEAHNLVVRDVTTKPQIGHAGMLVIVTCGVSTVAHSSSPIGGLKEWDYLYTHPAFMHGYLGKSAPHLLIALLKAGEPMTKVQLAHAVGRKSRDIRKPLAKLMGFEVVTDVSGCLAPVPDFKDALENAAQITGATKRLDAQKAHHKLERELFQDALERGRLKRLSSGTVPVKRSLQ
jgi:hypothetical protein